MRVQWFLPVVALTAACTSIDSSGGSGGGSNGDCHSSYTGCVPIASDVDCAGGSGNGPAYTGRVDVVGADVYDLDRDGDGVACE